MHRRPPLHIIALSVALFGASPPAAAGGFYLRELGTPYSLGTAGVGNVVNDQTADAAWANPAGMTGINGDTAIGGMQLALPLVEFEPSVATAGGEDGGNAGVVAPIPSAFYVKSLSARTKFGLGLSGLLGGGVDYGDAFVGRYSAIQAELAGAGLSGALAYKLNDAVSVGVGLTVLYTVLYEEIAVNQSALGAADGKVVLDDIDDVGLQGYFGLQWRMTPRALLGSVYRSEVDVDLEGDMQFRGLRLPLSPVQTNKVAVAVSGDWEDWSEFSDNQFQVTGGRLGAQALATIDRNWRDTWYLGAAMTYRPNKQHQFSAGISYDSSPVRDGDRTFDLPVDQQWRFSGAYAWRGKQQDFALGGTLMYMGEGKIDQTSQRVRAAGEFDNNLLVFLGGTPRLKS